MQTVYVIKNLIATLTKKKHVNLILIILTPIKNMIMSKLNQYNNIDEIVSFFFLIQVYESSVYFTLHRIPQFGLGLLQVLINDTGRLGAALLVSTDWSLLFTYLLTSNLLLLIYYLLK